MHHLTSSSATAAENMALDQLMLEAYPEPAALRFRHYGWTEPAYTFGFAQTWGAELEALAQKHKVIRRETGGGLVNHNRDWTWALVLPLEHPAAEAGLTCLYSGLHRALHQALTGQGVPVLLQSSAPEPLLAGAFRQCFTRAERDDVVLPDGCKVAGAAQRRTRAGILVQGYVDRSPLPGLDWARLEDDFVQILGAWLESPAQPMAIPAFPSEGFRAMRERFASASWNRYRKRSDCTKSGD